MVPFETAVIKLQEALGTTSTLVMPTLGRKSNIAIYIRHNQIIIRNSKNNEGIVDKLKWDTVYERREALGDNKNKTSMYGDPIWSNRPRYLDRYLTPYIPAVMRYLEHPTDFEIKQREINPSDPGISAEEKKLFATLRERLVVSWINYFKNHNK